MTHKIESSAFGWDHGSVMMKWQTCPEVSRNPQVVSSDYVFKGTRVPIRALFEISRTERRSTTSLIGFPA